MLDDVDYIAPKLFDNAEGDLPTLKKHPSDMLNELVERILAEVYHVFLILYPIHPSKKWLSIKIFEVSTSIRLVMNSLPSEIINLILKDTRFQDLDSVKMSCKDLSFLVIEERKRRLRPILQHFKLPNNTFDTFTRLGAYISGSVALSLALNQPLYEDSDLDLYIQIDSADTNNAAQLELFIKDLGYKVHSDEDTLYLDQTSTCPIEVKSFLNNDNLKIQIINVAPIVPLYIRTQFFSFHVMNWFHDNTLTVSYPYNVYNRLIELSESPRNSDHNSNTPKVIEKYQARGFRFDGMNSPYQILRGLKLRGSFTHASTMQQLIGILTDFIHEDTFSVVPDRADIMRMLVTNLNLTHEVNDTGEDIFREQWFREKTI